MVESRSVVDPPSFLANFHGVTQALRATLLACLLLTILAKGAAASSPLPRSAPLAALLDEQTGVILVHDKESGAWHASDPAAAEVRHAPFSTFKVWNTLAGLEAGVLSGPETFIAWDRERFPRESLFVQAWAADHTLRSAYRNSVVWYYQVVAERIGADRMQRFLDRVGYGNRDLSGGLTRFWLGSSLRISPREQVERLDALLAGRLAVQPEHLAVLEDIALVERRGACGVYGKSGGGLAREDRSLWQGWFIGWLRCGDRLTTFATFLEAAEFARIRDARYRLSRDALKTLGYLPTE